MRIELLWWEGCPSHPETLADLRAALREEQLDEGVEMIEIETDAQAREQRFPGSPTFASTARTSSRRARASPSP